MPEVGEQGGGAERDTSPANFLLCTNINSHTVIHRFPKTYYGASAIYICESVCVCVCDMK